MLIDPYYPGSKAAAVVAHRPLLAERKQQRAAQQQRREAELVETQSPPTQSLSAASLSPVSSRRSSWCGGDAEEEAAYAERQRRYACEYVRWVDPAYARDARRGYAVPHLERADRELFAALHVGLQGPEGLRGGRSAHMARLVGAGRIEEVEGVEVYLNEGLEALYEPFAREFGAVVHKGMYGTRSVLFVWVPAGAPVEVKQFVASSVHACVVAAVKDVLEELGEPDEADPDLLPLPAQEEAPTPAAVTPVMAPVPCIVVEDARGLWAAVADLQGQVQGQADALRARDAELAEALRARDAALAELKERIVDCDAYADLTLMNVQEALDVAQADYTDLGRRVDEAGAAAAAAGAQAAEVPAALQDVRAELEELRRAVAELRGAQAAKQPEAAKVAAKAEPAIQAAKEATQPEAAAEPSTATPPREAPASKRGAAASYVAALRA